MNGDLFIGGFGWQNNNFHYGTNFEQHHILWMTISICIHMSITIIYLYMCVWVYMIIYDYIWLYITIYDYIWLYMTIYYYIWLYMIICDYIHMYIISLVPPNVYNLIIWFKWFVIWRMGSIGSIGIGLVLKVSWCLPIDWLHFKLLFWEVSPNFSEPFQ
jgi:hypothetical protein